MYNIIHPNRENVNVRFYIPQTLDIHTIKKSIRYKIAYIIHLLYVKRFTDDDKYTKLDKWRPLQSSCLQEIIGTRLYKQVMDYCITHNIVECDKHYYSGRSRRYRMSPQYQQTKYTPIECSDRVVKRNIIERRESYIKGMDNNYKWVCKWIK